MWIVTSLQAVPKHEIPCGNRQERTLKSTSKGNREQYVNKHQRDGFRVTWLSWGKLNPYLRPSLGHDATRPTCLCYRVLPCRTAPAAVAQSVERALRKHTVAGSIRTGRRLSCAGMLVIQSARACRRAPQSNAAIKTAQARLAGIGQHGVGPLRGSSDDSCASPQWAVLRADLQ